MRLPTTGVIIKAISPKSYVLARSNLPIVWRKTLASIGVVLACFFKAWELLNSHLINLMGLHKLLPLRWTEKISLVCSRIPVFTGFSTMTQFIVARKFI